MRVKLAFLYALLAFTCQVVDTSYYNSFPEENRFREQSFRSADYRNPEPIPRDDISFCTPVASSGRQTAYQTAYRYIPMAESAPAQTPRQQNIVKESNFEKEKNAKRFRDEPKNKPSGRVQKKARFLDATWKPTVRLGKNRLVDETSKTSGKFAPKEVKDQGLKQNNKKHLRAPNLNVVIPKSKEAELERPKMLRGKNTSNNSVVKRADFALYSKDQYSKRLEITETTVPSVLTRDLSTIRKLNDDGSNIADPEDVSQFGDWKYDPYWSKKIVPFKPKAQEQPLTATTTTATHQINTPVVEITNSQQVSVYDVTGEDQYQQNIENGNGEELDFYSNKPKAQEQPLTATTTTATHQINTPVVEITNKQQVSVYELTGEDQYQQNIENGNGEEFDFNSSLYFELFEQEIFFGVQGPQE